MITEGLDAWILHKRESGETSVQLTLFTREKGLVRAEYRGGRTPKKQGSLHVFTPLWLTLDVRRDWHYVRQLEAISPSFVLTGDGLFAGLYVNELLYHALSPLDSVPDFYDVYVETLRALSVASERMMIEVVLRRFEWQLLMVCGYQMSLTHDAQSGAPIQTSDHYAFIPGKGFVLNSNGFEGAHIMAWASDILKDISVLRTIKLIMRQAIDHALDGRPIQARKLYPSGLSH